MKLFWQSLLALAVGSSAYAQNHSRPITHEIAWSMRHVGAPVVSRDGKWAVVLVTEPNYQTGEVRQNLWLLSISGEVEPRQITGGREVESGVQWSPNGQALAFSAKREGDSAAQIYLLDLASGGEAGRITHREGGARHPQWSADGKWIAYVGNVYPNSNDKDLSAPGVETKPNVRVYENYPVRIGDRWVGKARIHLFVQEANASDTPRDLFAKASLAQNAGFGGRLTETEESLPFGWTADGKGIVFAATLDGDKLAYSEVNTQLFFSPTDGGEMVQLTNDAGSYGLPVFSCDGKVFVCAFSPSIAGHTYNERRLVSYPWPFEANGRKVVTATFDGSPFDPVISPDGSRVFFSAEQNGQERIFSAGFSNGAVKLEFESNNGSVAHLTGAGQGDAFRLVALWASSETPGEAVALDPRTRPAVLKRLSHFNTGRLEGLDLFPAEHVWTQNARGEKIHSLLFRPANFDPARKYPLVAWVHDGPHATARDDFNPRANYHLLAGSEFVVVVPDYAGSVGFGEAFARRTEDDPLKGTADDINGVVEEVIRRYAFIDGGKAAAIGFGYGANVVNWLEATTTRYRCLVAHAGMIDSEGQRETSDIPENLLGLTDASLAARRDQTPLNQLKNRATKAGWSTPILVSSGEKDFHVPLNNALQTWTYMQRFQLPSRLLLFPDEGHQISNAADSRAWYAEVHDWMLRWLVNP